MDDLISVIVPVYNVEKYLRRCVDSLLKQTYTNIEIILIDDGSLDRCGCICDEYSEKNVGVRVIHKQNGGLSDARNTGINIAKGKYIYFLDSDDWIHEQCLERLYKLLILTDSDIAVCNYIKLNVEPAAAQVLQETFYEFTNLEALKQMLGRLSDQMVISCGKLYKKFLFDQIRFPFGRIHEDEFITYKLILKARKVVYTTAQLLYYWQRNDSITNTTVNAKQRFDALDALEERAVFFENISQINLASLSYRWLFYLYMQYNSEIDEFLNIEDRDELLVRLHKFKYILKQSKQNIYFKIFYETYFVFPKLTALIYTFYKLCKKSIRRCILIKGSP